MSKLLGKLLGCQVNFVMQVDISPNICCRYYLIDDLILAVQKQLDKLGDDSHPISRVPVITGLDEERKIVSSSSKPVIKLLYNRGNNKYSYTP